VGRVHVLNVQEGPAAHQPFSDMIISADRGDAISWCRSAKQRSTRAVREQRFAIDVTSI
jgi:hypothetical protein